MHVVARLDLNKRIEVFNYTLLSRASACLYIMTVHNLFINEKMRKTELAIGPKRYYFITPKEH